MYDVKNIKFQYNAWIDVQRITYDIKKEEPYDSIIGGRAIVVHLSVILDFY